MRVLFDLKSKHVSFLQEPILLHFTFRGIREIDLEERSGVELAKKKFRRYLPLLCCVLIVVTGEYI